MDDRSVPCAETIGCLGLTVDSSLTRKPHIRQLRAQGQGSVRIFEPPGEHAEYRRYLCIICSRIGCRYFIRASLSKRVLSKIDPVHSTAIPLYPWMSRMSAVGSPSSGSEAPALPSRRQTLVCAYAASLSTIKQPLYTATHSRLPKCDLQSVPK
jgi:hypothetical protein